MARVNTVVCDGQGSERTVTITKYNQLVTAPAEFNTTKFQEMGTVDTAFNFVVPRADKQIVITGMSITTDKDVGVNGATIVVYENEVGEDDRTQTRVIYKTQLLKNTSIHIPDMNLVAEAGRWINAETDDDDVFMTLFFYYVPTPPA